MNEYATLETGQNSAARSVSFMSLGIFLVAQLIAAAILIVIAFMVLWAQLLYSTQPLEKFVASVALIGVVWFPTIIASLVAISKKNRAWMIPHMIISVLLAPVLIWCAVEALKKQNSTLALYYIGHFILLIVVFVQEALCYRTLSIS